MTRVSVSFVPYPSISERWKILQTGNQPINQPIDEMALLGSILKDLEPPQQDYSRLAAALADTGELSDPVARALSRYWQIFANGYAFWQQSYDYPRIHEYFWVAYMVVKREILDNAASFQSVTPEHLDSMLKHVSLAFIANTDCENSLVCNMPRWLQRSAQEALDNIDLALSFLEKLGLDARVQRPLFKFFDMHHRYYFGLLTLADLYLVPWQTQPDEAAVTAKLKTLADQLTVLKADSRELFSEFRAHLSHVQHNVKAFFARGGTSIRVKQADMTLRTVWYAGSDLIEALYNKFDDDKGSGPLRDFARKRSGGMPFSKVRSGYLNETFETNIGISLLAPVVMELPAGDDGIGFSLFDGEQVTEYTLDFFRVTITRFGAISIDFRFCIGDCDEKASPNGVTVSHVRALEALLGPHMGRHEIVWRNAPREYAETAEEAALTQKFIRPEATNFARVFYQAQEWIERARTHLPAEEFETWLRVTEDEKAPVMAAFDEWQSAFYKLQDRLMDTTRGSPYQEDAHGVKSYVPDLEFLKEKYDILRHIFTHEWAWIKTASPDDTPELSKLKEDAARIFPNGRVFLKMMDIAEEVQRRVQRFLLDLADEQGDNLHPDLRGRTYFDRNYGWQSILEVNQVLWRESDGTVKEPPFEIEYATLTKHPDFHGFEVTSREARAALDDWNLASAPPQQFNLAPIRSHKTDIFYVEQNRAFIFLPDDPQFIVNQYNDTARWASNLVTVTIAHEYESKNLIRAIEKHLGAIEQGEASIASLPRWRGRIQMMQRQSEQVLDLARGFAMTKYVDHSELLRALIKTSRLEFMTEILSENCRLLDRLYAYMGDLISEQVVYHLPTVEERFIDDFTAQVNAGLHGGEDQSIQVYNTMREQVTNPRWLELLDELKHTFDTAYQPQAFINVEVTEPNIIFEQSYDLLMNTLDPDVVDEKEAFIDFLGNSVSEQGQYVLMSRLSNVAGDHRYGPDGNLIQFGYAPGTTTINVAGVVSGNYLVLENHPGLAIGGLGQAASRKAMRGQGHGKQVVDAFEAKLQSIASERGETLALIVLEAESSARDFWARRGYRWPQGSQYMQPPISFDSATGLPNFEAVPELLMVKLVQPANTIERNFLIDVVRTLYNNWYIPGDVPDSMRASIWDYVFGDLFESFVKSLPEGVELIPLEKPLASDSAGHPH
jgi:hypothetical protein